MRACVRPSQAAGKNFASNAANANTFMAAFRSPARNQQQHVSTTQQKQQHVQHAASADVATLDALQEQMSAQLDREEEELRMARDNYIAARMGDRPANVDTKHENTKAKEFDMPGSDFKAKQRWLDGHGYHHSDFCSAKGKRGRNKCTHSRMRQTARRR